MSISSDYWLRFRSSGGGYAPAMGTGWRGPGAGPARASAFHGAVSGAPQVVVKVTGRSKTAKGVAAHLDYIGREGCVEMRDQDGEVVPRDAIADIPEDWGDPASGGPRTSVKAVALTFSMPKGTDARSVGIAVRDTLRREIGGNNDYILAQHHDTGHPHVHVLVRGEGRDGRTYNPRPDDLHRLREGFARQLNERGIEAEATPCAFRMERQRGVSMALTKMVERSGQGEIDPPRRAAKVMRDELGAHETLPGLVRPTNRSEAKRWTAALEFWARGGEALPPNRDDEGPGLAFHMEQHTRIACERGFGEVEHLPRDEVRQRLAVEKERGVVRDRQRQMERANQQVRERERVQEQEQERDAPVMER